MSRSTSLSTILAALTRQARAFGWTDTEWATRAGVRKETLSRLRHRDTCDFVTLRTLADAVGLQLGVQEADATVNGHFPTAVSRDYEERLVELCASGSLDTERWSQSGPRFFMAGLAVMLASVPDQDRRGLLALAERLHPGATEPAVFTQWLERSPVRPTRFLPLLESAQRRAA
jgi:hypothetical protein